MSDDGDSGPDLDPQRDRALAEALRTASISRATNIAREMCGTRGASGDAALREALTRTGAGSRDLKNYALHALVERLGPDGAADDLRAILNNRDGGLRWVAVSILTRHGTASVFPDVKRYLYSIGRRKKNWGTTSEVMEAVTYLGAYLPDDPSELEWLVNEVRSAWDFRLDGEAHWFDVYWPGVRPGGPPAAEVGRPDVAGMRRWLATPGPLLFWHTTDYPPP